MNDYKLNTVSPERAGMGYVGVLLNEVFGYRWQSMHDVSLDTKPGGLASPYTVILEDTVDYEDAPVRYGAKAWGAFWFEAGEYKKYDHKGKLVAVSLPELLMPLASLVSFSRDKKVTETNDVIETSMMNKWSIAIQGIIFNDPYNPLNQQTVEEQMEWIQNYHETANSIRVRGQIFANRDITRIVTTSLKFDPVQGKPGMWQYSMEAVSDYDFLLTETA